MACKIDSDVAGASRRTGVQRKAVDGIRNRRE